MRKLSVLLMCIVSGVLVQYDAAAQEPGVIFFQHRQFQIPFKNDPKNTNITHVRLYVSKDQGRSWEVTATAAPDERYFKFSTVQDGFFCFAVQTIDSQGKTNPPTVDDFRPNLKVIVDTLPPSVQVQPLQPRAGQVGVSWFVRDDNLDTTLPDAVQLQYRLAGSVTWQPLYLAPGSQQHYWDPKTNARVEVRILAKDRVGNVGEGKTTVSMNDANGGAGMGFQNPVADPPAYIPGPDIPRRFVNTEQVTFLYDVSDVGPSGVKALELWFTQLGIRSWNKHNEYELKADKKLTIKMQPTEGIYGYTLIAKSGVGLGERPPQAGDRPQFWIEVDVTKPSVNNLDVQVGTGVNKGKLNISWVARDKNLSAKPIKLWYGEPDNWRPCVEEPLTNQGRYVWTMPDPVPFEFYLRVEAVDLAGNSGEAVTPEKVKVDLSLPKAKIRDIEPQPR